MKILPSQGLDSWTANAKQTASSLGFSHYSVSLFSKYVFPINTCCLNGWLEWMNNSMRTWKRSILSYLWEKGRPHAKECHLLWEKVRLNQKLAKVKVFPGYRSTRAEASPTKESVAFPGTPRVSSVPGLVSICLEGTKEAGEKAVGRPWWHWFAEQPGLHPEKNRETLNHFKWGSTNTRLAFHNWCFSKRSFLGGTSG